MTAARLRILVAEPLQSMTQLSRAMLEADGHEVHCALTLRAAEARAAARCLDVILLDPALAGATDLGLVANLAERAGAPVVAVSANGSIAQAVAAMRAGAADYLVKPVSRERLRAALAVAVSAARATARLAMPVAPEAPAGGGFHRFIGGSPAMLEVYRRLRAVAPSTAPVFITGESGTGKELAALAVHELGPRAAGPFVALNCGAIPRELLESEVFGHVRGAFTGAIADRPGAIRAANGGTLFLDEICELDPALQTKLLRVVESGLVQPVGAATAEQVQVRIVCATNRTPSAEVSAGRFREDLYFRLHVLPVHLPPLRMRGDDVLAIARGCLDRMAREEGKAFEGFSSEAERALMAHAWPGNVRELQNLIRQAVVLNGGRVIEASMLGFADAGSIPAHAVLDALADSAVQPLRALRGDLAAGLKDMQRQAIERAIAACGGSVPRAARMLGLAPSTIYRRRETWSGAERSAGRPC